MYSIKDLDRITGIKAHTIRIWEQRYHLLQPDRTSTNIRFYDDEQLKKLLNVSLLINSGMKISHISKLTKKQLIDTIQKIEDSKGRTDLQIESLINNALVAASTFDEVLFEKVFSNSILRFGIKDTYLNILYPLLVKVGLMWTRDSLLPSQEHFLSNLIKQKLYAAIDSLPVAPNTKPLWVLFLSEKEEHEIGLLFANYILRQNGNRVVFLGQKVPYENLAEVVVSCKPNFLYTFFVKRQPEEEVSKYFKKIRKDFKGQRFCVSGNSELFSNCIAKYQLTYLKNVDDLTNLFESN